ncbi:HAMP domain-containing sensor histidine kinase [Clostridium sp. E02]|uniref:HAMP domain-containing sensor histidine kinase n=1 Tax=Clostridium sp. E02 TaxID=2487134 RepID=UPI000F525954|nr:HAMP domain-containing sensor histidine kinase [Clostridium sp. E02]
MKSLRKQLSFSIFFTLLLTILLIGVLSNWFITREFESYISEIGEKRRENIVEELSRQYDGLQGKFNHDLVHAIGMNALYDGYILKLSDENGGVVWDAQDHDMSLCGRIMDDITARMRKRGAEGGFVNHMYEVNQNGQKIGTLSIQYYGPFFMSEADFNFIKVMNTILLSIGILSSFCSVVVGCYLAKRIARPVAKTAYIAKQISQGNYNIHFEPGTGICELDDMGSAINELSGALNDQEALRKQMTADVAHELRTPLTALGSHLEAMIEGFWEPTPKRLSSCHEEVKRLGTLVADLEQLAKIEGENLHLKKDFVDLVSVVSTVSDAMTGEIRKKDQDFSLIGDSVIVKGDRDRISQVVANLLSNAVKYTKEGGRITITVEEEKYHGVIKVTDTGMGIGKKELPLVFQRFYRTDQSRNRKSGGAGIGLAIVKSIVSAHGGTVTVDSETDKGSCFTVKLPR